MLDEKGRLFGKINIVDLIIVVVLIAAVAFVGIKYVFPEDDTGEEQEFTIILNCQYAPKYTIERLQEGATAVNGDKEYAWLGTVEKWEVSPYYEYFSESASELGRYESDYFDSCRIWIKTKGVLTENYYLIDDIEYASGHTFVCYMGDAKMYLKVEGLAQ